MKKLLLFALTLFLSFHTHSQTVVSSCSAPDSIIKKYRKDADRLAVRREYHINSTFTDSVRIDPVLRTTYMAALVAVYNATLLTIRDTVVNMFNTHTKPDPEMNTLLLKADQGNAWMQNLKNSISPTTYPPIDQLISKYHLQNTGYYQSTQYDVAVLTADSSYNMPALTHTFALVPSVFGSDVNPVVFNDVKNITDSINPAFTMLSYSYGWGSCQDGCDFRAYWTFKVYNDCKVEYIGHTGDAIGSGTVGIKQNSAVFNTVQLYPNPAGETLYIRADSPLNKTITLEVLNLLGQAVLQAKTQVLTGTTEVNLRELPAGIYYVKLKSDEGQRTFKLLKE